MYRINFVPFAVLIFVKLHFHSTARTLKDGEKQGSRLQLWVLVLPKKIQKQSRKSMNGRRWGRGKQNSHKNLHGELMNEFL